MAERDDQDARHNKDVTPAATLCLLTDRYFQAFSGDLAEPWAMYQYAMDIADLCAHAAINEPPANISKWSDAFDTWLTRATQHALQVGALGRREG